MEPLLAEPPLAATGLESRAASAPAIDSDTYPLLMNFDREPLPWRRSSDGGPEGKKNDEAKPRWPVRQYSASSDPLTRDRRIKRLETFIDKAKQRKTSYREPLRRPSDGTYIRRVRTAPTPIPRRSSTAVSSLLWLARPRSRGSSTPREASAESLLRRVSQHIKVRAQLQDELPAKTSSEESFRSSRSAPEAPVAGPSFSSSTTPESSGSQHRHNHHQHCIPSLHLCAYRSPSSTRAHASSSSDHDSPSSSSVASIKSTCADTATTLTDVHVVKVPQSKRNELLSPGEATPSPSMHLIESGHGSYHVLWDEPPSCHLSTSDRDSMSVGPDEDAPQSPLPTGLDQVNTKLEEWSFAARECTALDKSRSHPHFRPYVEVYQDDDEPQFDMDDDGVFMAPPNTEHPTPGSSAWDSRRSSEAEGENAHRAPLSFHGRSNSGSFSFDDVSGPESQHQDDDTDEPLTGPHHRRYSDDLLLTGGYYSPRPKEVVAADRRRSDARSLSSLSNTSDMSDNAASLLANHRDSVDLMSERYQDEPEPELPVDNPWSHRDSVAIAKERIRKKHANETGEALVGGVGILKGVGKGGFERTPPLVIPRLQQVTLMGVLSPIPDSSPPNANKWDEACGRSIDELTERG